MLVQVSIMWFERFESILMSILIELSTTPIYLFALFVVLTGVFHAVFVFWLKLDDLAWKKIDYIWLGAATLGILVSSSQADRLASRLHLENLEAPLTETAYKFLRSYLADPPSICRPRFRSEFSPLDFDQIVQEQQSLCKQSKEIAATMPAQPPIPFPLLDKIGFASFGQDAKYEVWFVLEVNRLAEEYRHLQRQYAAFSESAQRMPIAEKLFTVMGPLLLAFALALRITKVTGELTNAQTKAET